MAERNGLCYSLGTSRMSEIFAYLDVSSVVLTFLPEGENLKALASTCRAALEAVREHGVFSLDHYETYRYLVEPDYRALARGRVNRPGRQLKLFVHTCHSGWLDDYLVLLSQAREVKMCFNEGYFAEEVPWSRLPRNVKRIEFVGLGDTLEFLAPLTSLEEICICSSVIDLVGLQHLRSLKKAEFNCQFTNSSDALASLPNLRELKLTTSLSSVSVLGVANSVRRLEIVGDELSDLSALLGYRNLTSLHISGDEWKIDLPDLDFLANCEKLTELTIEFCYLEDLSVLKKLKNLSSLCLSHTNVDRATAQAAVAPGVTLAVDF